MVFRNMVLVSLTAGLILTMGNSPSAQEKCQTLDAVTTATLQLTNQSRACETTADFYFTYNKVNGSRLFSYGTTTTYGTAGGDAAGGRAKTINLSGLKPGTKYYFKVEGIYDDIIEYTMKGEFTTQSTAAPVVSDFSTAQAGTRITIGNNPIVIPMRIDKSVTVELYTISGVRVLKHTLTIDGASAFVPIELPNGNGTYLCKITGSQASFAQKIILSK